MVTSSGLVSRADAILILISSSLKRDKSACAAAPRVLSRVKLPRLVSQDPRNNMLRIVPFLQRVSCAQRRHDKRIFVHLDHIPFLGRSSLTTCLPCKNDVIASG